MKKIDTMNDDPVVRHAERVRQGNWKSVHTEFINAQFDLHERFMQRLMQTPDGKKRIKELYNIKNLKGHPSLQ